ncbi:MAG: hypothetical protein P9M14_12535 [Candidatus Alcyoniella australis]|nr:hypothetical protein [Candidatus Alcyoniella australis]
MHRSIFAGLVLLLLLGPACYMDLDCDYDDDAWEEDDDQPWLDQDEPEWDEGPPWFVSVSIDDCQDQQDPCAQGDRVLVEAEVNDPEGYQDVAAVEFQGPYSTSHMVVDPNRPWLWVVHHTFDNIEQDGLHSVWFIARDDVGRLTSMEGIVYLQSNSGGEE